MRNAFACLLVLSLAACTTPRAAREADARPVMCQTTEGKPDEPLRCVERYEGALRLCRHYRKQSQKRIERRARRHAVEV